MTSPSKGFSLITVLLWLVLLGLVSLLLYLRLADQLETLPASERQLYSLVMAQNGIEYARARLPALEIDSLLAGPDGMHAGSYPAEWRNPLPWAVARFTDPETIVLTPDDGLVVDFSGQILNRGYRAPQQGYFFLRFSNNPEEPPDADRDGVVLVRSLGVSRSRLPAISLGGVLHSTSLIEARLRQERVFDLGSALTLFSDSGRFRWEGQAFQVRGGLESAIGLISNSGGTLETDLENSLEPSQRDRIGGSGSAWADQAPLWNQDAQKRRVFSARFWEHFLEHLPEFSEPAIPGLRYLAEGGSMGEKFTGVLVARGPLRLTGGARVNGLLLHLGGGPLQLQGDATIRGGVWMSSTDGSTLAPSAVPIELEVGGRARIAYDGDAIARALCLFPPTQLGWRLLSPEMVL